MTLFDIVFVSTSTLGHRARCKSEYGSRPTGQKIAGQVVDQEGKWIDQRRFAKPLALDMPDFVRNIRSPIPLDECNARPGEPACDVGST